MSKRFKIDFKNLDWVKTFYAVLLIGAFVVIVVLSVRGPPPAEPITRILIESDEDFAEKYNFEGEGTASSPYIISNFTLDTGEDTGIEIRDTTMHFVIRYCNITNADTGILIDNIANGTALIQKNDFLNNTFAIKIFGTKDIVVNNNTIRNSQDYGIQLGATSENVTIYYNDFIENNLGGSSQAFDNGVSNYWYNSVLSVGNYWSDIGGNSTYAIDGTAGSIDNEPSTTPYF